MARAIKWILPIVALLVYGTAGNAVAGTSAYVTSGNLTKTVEQCLKDMRVLAEKTGFTLAQETLIDKNGMAGDFHADKTPLHSAMQLSQQDLGNCGERNQQRSDLFSVQEVLRSIALKSPQKQAGW